MAEATNSRRRTGWSYGILGALLGLPLAGILVFVMLLPSEHVIGNVLASVLLGLVPAALTAFFALLLMRRTGRTGPVQGVLAALAAYLVFFLLLGIYGSDVPGVIATGLHMMLTVPVLWLFPILAAVTGFVLRRKST